jgi:hypothetical protein
MSTTTTVFVLRSLPCSPDPVSCFLIFCVLWGSGGLPPVGFFCQFSASMRAAYCRGQSKRGGSFNNEARNVRVAVRNRNTNVNNNNGFRVALAHNSLC